MAEYLSKWYLAHPPVMQSPSSFFDSA